jgi:glycosyltransferase
MVPELVAEGWFLSLSKVTKLPHYQKMKISIITATYNSEKTIKSCLQSVKSQDYENIEHIIIDGKSTDNTLSFLSKYAESNPNVTYITEPDKGIYDALNKGLQLATGDVLGFLHSDDEFYDQSTITKIAAAFDQNNPDGVYGNLNYISSTDDTRVIRFWKSKPFQHKMLTEGWMPPHPTLFLKSKVYHKHGPFDLSYKISADYDFILRIFKDDALRFTYIAETITNMRMGGASSNFKNLKEKMIEDLNALKKNALPAPYAVILRKNISKLPQLFKRDLHGK